MTIKKLNSNRAVRFRKSFGNINEILDIPNLIEVQKNSYDIFLQKNVDPKDRKNIGLQKVLNESFPIINNTSTCEVNYLHYTLSDSRYDVDECKERGMTYAGSLKLLLRMIIFKIDKTVQSKKIVDIKEQDVYVCDIPLITPEGTFVINGLERVVVSQMHKSPGLFLGKKIEKIGGVDGDTYTANIIPYKGFWLEINISSKDVFYIRFDKRRKLSLTSLLYALDNDETAEIRQEAQKTDEDFDPIKAKGLSPKELISFYYDKLTFVKVKDGWETSFKAERDGNIALNFDLVDAGTKKVIITSGTTITPFMLKKLHNKKIFIIDSDLVNFTLFNDIVDPKTGELLMPFFDDFSSKYLKKIRENTSIKEIDIIDTYNGRKGLYIRNSIVQKPDGNKQEALLEIYKVMRPGDPLTLIAADNFFNELFNHKRYNLSLVGRKKINSKLDYSKAEEPDAYNTVLQRKDILNIVKKVVDLRDGMIEPDDIDDLSNRRVRSVGEQLENRILIGMMRMEKIIKDRLSSPNALEFSPYDLISTKIVSAVIKDFFNSSQLSQFMDQVNPLAEITHKRRLSSLGPGGLSRERAGFEVRDVHPSHYGRICPIETPEGQNIGLINSLATYAIVNDYGFIETPYRKVKNKTVTKDIIYMTSEDEKGHIIAQSNSTIKNNKLSEDLIQCRQNGESITAHVDEVDFIEVAPKQLVSVAASLIPFLENDDANRALMGANMQRQAVPLLSSQAPVVGTGIEANVAVDSGAAIVATKSGIIDQVDSKRIVINSNDVTSKETGIKIYNLRKYKRSNHDTCINQKPVVQVGERVERGDVIADGSATNLGELALGKNILVAFMPWNGYNYEDSILVSERIARNDIFTSIHIEELNVVARDTKIGPEEITRDIPGVGEEGLRHLDETGIVYIGAKVKSGDVIVGKVSPKGEVPVTPEEKLLKAIFGEKSSDMKDSSLRMPAGKFGTVIDVKIFNRRGLEKDERSRLIDEDKIAKLKKDKRDEIKVLDNFFSKTLRENLSKITKIDSFKLDNKSINKASLIKKSLHNLLNITVDKTVKDAKTIAIAKKLDEIKTTYNKYIKNIEGRFDDRIQKIYVGDDLGSGVLKTVKILIAVKRKLQAGDKLAGRHGNKGVVSIILPEEDMPYMQDGTPVDMVLNPLGVPSRMNIGQIMETHLGWASKKLGDTIKKTISLYEQNGDISLLKETIKFIYEDNVISNKIDKLKDDEILSLAYNIKDGIPFATPVFDGASENDINKYLSKAEVATSGQITLIDGKTGEPFDKKITVGYMYILKLNHLIDNKIHARSTGSYSLVTQQPLGGKSQFGGQRFGEMEVWALESYGAAYTLLEMQTYKSDFVEGRVSVYESIIQGTKSFKSGVPESFKVLERELQSLAINIKRIEK